MPPAETRDLAASGPAPCFPTTARRWATCARPSPSSSRPSASCAAASPQRRGPLTFAQYRLLLRLDEGDGCTGNELAAAAVDRRVVVARLTPIGRERLAAKRAELDAAWRAAFGELSDDELAQGAVTARRIAAFLDTL